MCINNSIKLINMKRIALFGLFAFVLGTFTFAASNYEVTITTEISNDNDCDKCGKEDCSGKCTDATAKKCTKSGKSCCKKKAAESTSTDGTAQVKAETTKKACSKTEKSCCKAKKACSKSTTTEEAK